MSMYTWSTRYNCTEASFMAKHVICIWYEKQPGSHSDIIEQLEGRDLRAETVLYLRDAEAHLDDSHTTSKLGNALTQLLCVIH